MSAAPGHTEEEPLAARVFRRLAEGGFHSGQALARDLAVTRSAIWKAVSALRGLGVEMEAVRNRGYRLATACEPLDAARIRSLLAPRVCERLSGPEVVWAVTSTNDVLLARGTPGAGRASALLAEHQSAGRGRRGRAWLAPPGGSVSLSLGWGFAEAPRDLAALGLVMGVCVLRALQRLGARGLELKWPNDVLCERRKLAGILTELRGESAGPITAVVGIGVNAAIPPRLRESIAASALEPADLADAGLGATRRNEVAAALLDSCVLGLEDFEHDGARGFRDEWQKADALRDREITVHFGEGASRGVARGVDLAGQLVVQTPSGVQKFVSGDVSVRFER